MMKISHEDARLQSLKDKFLKFWPTPCQLLYPGDDKFINSSDKVLVVGSGRTQKVQAGDLTCVDIREYEGVDVVADAQDLPFDDASFDVVVCHQVLEHIPEPVLAIKEMHRVLKTGGKVVISIPFMFPFHASPFDFRRWTANGLEKEFKGFSKLESGMYYGPLSTLLCMIQTFFSILIPNFYLSYIVKGCVGLLLMPFKYLDLLLRFLPNAEHMAMSIYYVAKKKP